MAGKSDLFSNALLNLVFQGTEFAGIFQNVDTDPVTEYWISLHTADPGPSGNQATSEVNYTSYARVSIARSSGGWTTSSAESVSPLANIVWPTSTQVSGGPTAAYWGIGTAESGAGQLLYSGPITPTIACTNGVAPTLLSSSTVTEA
jgi:hypothetical protein